MNCMLRNAQLQAYIPILRKLVLRYQTSRPFSQPGENFEVRRTASSDHERKSDPSKSIKLPSNRQARIDDIIALYSYEPTVELVERYSLDCFYDHQFVLSAIATRRPVNGSHCRSKLFEDGRNVKYESTKHDRDFIECKNEQSWTFAGIHKTAVTNAVVSLSLDRDMVDSYFIQIEYRNDQANRKD